MHARSRGFFVPRGDLSVPTFPDIRSPCHFIPVRGLRRSLPSPVRLAVALACTRHATPQKAAGRHAVCRSLNWIGEVMTREG